MTADDQDGGLRKRVGRRFVQVPRGTIRDRRLGFKERGLLSYLLDMPRGYKPTVQNLTEASDDDGKTSVTSGLANLRKYGYYRVERRQMLDGRLVTGSSVSEDAVPEWVRDHEEHGGKPIPLIQQKNGKYKVKRADGSLDSDGFDDVDQSDDEDDEAASSQVRPEAGFPGPVKAAPDEPRPDAPGPQDPGTSTENEVLLRDEEHSEPSLRSGSATPVELTLIDGEGQRHDQSSAQTAGGAPTKAPKKRRTTTERAEAHAAAVSAATQIVKEYLKWWSDKRPGVDPETGETVPAPITDPKRIANAMIGAGNTPDGASYVTSALLAGWSRDEIVRSLGAWGDPAHPQRSVMPPRGWLNSSLPSIRGRRDPNQRGGGPQRRTDSYSNDRWREDPTGGFGAKKAAQ